MSDDAASTLQASVDELGRRLSFRLSELGLTVATAESLTGGRLATALTSRPGSSAVFLAGTTAYADEAKLRLLDVRAETLARWGAVSAECAREMAQGARNRIGAQIGVSTTGIAGPDGATPGKPVGLVHAAAAGPDLWLGRRFFFDGPRDVVALSAAEAALQLLEELLDQSPAGRPAENRPAT
ncbi:MAG: CinA family protein [Deltaproteobacteria bacterium]|jgi:nicotinamide-nucleotide amidase|nr:CinA family protein [Deltaproteobacteria bacterium]